LFLVKIFTIFGFILKKCKKLECSFYSKRVLTYTWFHHFFFKLIIFPKKTYLLKLTENLMYIQFSFLIFKVFMWPWKISIPFRDHNVSWGFFLLQFLVEIKKIIGSSFPWKMGGLQTLTFFFFWNIFHFIHYNIIACLRFVGLWGCWETLAISF